MFIKDSISSLNRLWLDEAYDAPGYGVVTDSARQAIRELAQSEGILLDPAYTGRAFHGMLDCLDRGSIPLGSAVLFWHTGGLPAIFDYSNDLQIAANPE